MSTIENINGFQLFEVDNEGLNYDGEWITIIKNKNELPYVKIKCSVLYYERATGTSGGSGTTADDKMFYREAGGDINQSGWMRGFPLFDIGDTANWTAYDKILSAGWEYDGDGATYYRPPTIDLSGNTDISNSLIVIDFQNLPRNLAGDDYLRGDLKYLVLRLKWSEEKFVSNAGAATVSTYGRSWYRRWYTYTYYCDIVNPSECLDFNTNLLRMKFDPGASSSGTTNPLPWWLTVNGQPSSSSSVDSYTELTAGIKLYPTENDIINAIFPTYNTPSSGEIPDVGGAFNKFPGYFQLCVNRSSPTTQGNWRNYWSVAADEKTYPSELFDYPTPATSGWLTTIDISGTGSNDQFGPDPSGIYTCQNVLWCSLQSPIWMDLSRNFGTNRKRYIINFADTSGGYGRDNNTIDLARGTSRPYYSNTDTNAANPNTNDTYVPANSAIRQYASLENNTNPFPFTTTNYYDIFFKLLILPKLVNTVSVKYTFGQDISSVVTFWRGVDPSSVPWCDGSADPTGIDNSVEAVRSSESITLTWDNTVDASKNIPIKRIRFIDIASGASKSTPTISQTPAAAEAIFNDLSDNNLLYDISANVFQIRLRDESYTKTPGDDDYDQTKAMIKNFNIALGVTHAHKFLIDQIPINYIPYRIPSSWPVGRRQTPILDWTNTEAGINSLYFNPWKIISDPAEYNMSDPSPLKENATLLQPTNNQKIFIYDNVENISFNYTSLTDNSFNLYLTPNITNAQEQAFKAILVGKLDNSPPYTPFTIRPYNSKSSNKENNDSKGRPNPTTLEQANKFIPDYWQWNGRLYSLGTKLGNPTGSADIRIFANQLTCAGIVEPVNVQIYQQYMLINTAFGATDQINIAYPTPATPESNTETTAKTEFVGGDSVDPPISQVSASMKFTLVGEVLEDLGAETKWPYTEEFDKEVTDYNYTGLFRAKNTYVDLDTAAKRKRWNNLYKLNVKGANDNDFNANFLTIQAVPDPIYVNCVELPPPEHLNNGTMLNASNTKVTIIWKAYYFDEVTQGDIYWTVMRTNVITLKTTTLLSDTRITPLDGDYRYVDSSIRIYDKYYYTVSGVFKWNSEGLAPEPPLPTGSLSLSVGSFSSATLIVCINNQFPFGRYNTTSTNLKLYRPLRLTTAGGQCSEVDEFGNTSGRCTGGVCQGFVNGKLQNLYNPGRSNGGTRNIYHNTTNQLTGKQIYVLLAKSASRPFR